MLLADAPAGNNLLGMHWLDWAVLVGYFILIVAIGLLFKENAALLVFLAQAVYAGDNLQLAPDGSWVKGNPELAPDGSWVGGDPHLNQTHIDGLCFARVDPTLHFFLSIIGILPKATWIG